MCAATRSIGSAAALAVLLAAGCGVSARDECDPSCGPAFECYYGACVPRSGDAGDGGGDADVPDRADDGPPVDIVTEAVDGVCVECCETTGDCLAYEDGDLCNGRLRCDLGTGACVIDPATIVTCPPTGSSCHVLACEPATGACIDDNPGNGTPCEDGDPCTEEDTCADGACVPGWNPCDDGNPCTDDFCVPGTSDCTHAYNTGPCEDGDPCTDQDTCDGAGGCVPGPTLPEFWPDADRDGFGSAAGPTACSATPPPGYAANDDDCCDSRYNVFPGQTEWFADAYRCSSPPSTDWTYDYNCDGEETKRWPSRLSCTWGDCHFVAAGWYGDAPECGRSSSFLQDCELTSDGTCQGIDSVYIPQECH